MINMTTFSKLSYKLFYALFIFILSWILLLNLEVDMERAPVILGVAFVLLLGLMVLKWWVQRQETLDYSHTKWTVLLEITIWLALFLIVSTIGLTLRVTPSWDYGAVHRDALEWVQQGKLDNVEYFARYSNNNLMLLVTVGFYKLVHLFSPHGTEDVYVQSTIVLNSLLITLSIFFTSMSAKKMYGGLFKYVCMLFLTLGTPILFYSNIFYTDTLGLFFISLLIYVIVSRLNNFSWLDGLVVGMLTVLGFKLKAFTLIILVALIIVLFLKENQLIRHKLFIIIVTLGSFALTNVALTQVMDSSIGLTPELYDEYQFPTSHWVMMSFNPLYDGGFNQDDYEETRDAGKMAEKNVLISDKLKKRLDQLGTTGMLHHSFYKKIKRTWTVGSMAVDDYAQRKNVNQTALHDVVTVNGKQHHSYYIVSQATHLLLVLLMLFSGIQAFIRRTDSLNLLTISIFGLTLFLVIWECNSRYLYSFIPLMVLVSLQFLAKAPVKKELHELMEEDGAD